MLALFWHFAAPGFETLSNQWLLKNLAVQAKKVKTHEYADLQPLLKCCQTWWVSKGGTLFCEHNINEVASLLPTGRRTLHKKS